jgi:hypothetical protein
MGSARRLHHSYDDYLRTLEMSAIKLEFCCGEMYALPGGPRRTLTWQRR